MVSDDSVQAEVSLQSSQSRSSTCGRLLCGLWAPPFRITDWFHPTLLFPRISPASAGESGEGGSWWFGSNGFDKHQNPCFRVFKPSWQRLFHKHSQAWSQVSKSSSKSRIARVNIETALISTTFMFNVSHHLWKLAKTRGHCVCNYLVRPCVCLFVFVCVCSCDWHAKKK